MKKFFYPAIFVLLAASFLMAKYSLADAPAGNNWFQLFTNVITGGDNTGDGGGGSNTDFYNYYYVGQSFSPTIGIKSDHTNAANIWIDYDSTIVSSSNLNTGTYFPYWSGQKIVSVSGNTYRVMSTGYQTSGNASGQGTFGSVTFNALKPSAFNYGTSTPATLLINTGVFGATTESNIAYLGNDILDSKEDFNFHVWADTKKPYGLNPSPANGSGGELIDGNYTFDLRDSKNGEGDNSGVGTGVNTAAPPGSITFNDGGGAVSYLSYTGYFCSGIWGSNLCNTTINPPSPLGIPGDARNWKYNTTYTAIISGYQDFASAHQDQLGDTNGPNTMNAKTWTFTTEADTVPPRVVAESPVRGSSGNSVSTNVSVDLNDKKFYPGNISGTGVDPTTCRINISSPSFSLTTYQQGSAGVTVVPIDYGYRYIIDPATDFAQNEVVSVSVYSCQDLAGNTMVTDNYTFSTADTDPPFVTDEAPENNSSTLANTSISFHLKDTGTGVNLANTVVYINGSYYTNAGGAGAVTTNGTRITYATSSNFNGGNYPGDPTVVSGLSNDYTFNIKPQANFTDGQAIPVIIYSRDVAGNLMERVVYAPVVQGGSCTSGSGYCGANTTWDSGLLQCVAGTGASFCGPNSNWDSVTSKCVGTGGGVCITSSGGGVSPILSISNAIAVPAGENAILVTWYSSLPGTSRVVYDTVSPADFGSAPNYNYANSTAVQDDNSMYHSVIVRGLKTNQVYYLSPVTKAGGNEVHGEALSMTTETKICQTAATTTCPAAQVKTVTRTVTRTIYLPATSSNNNVPPPITTITTSTEETTTSPVQTPVVSTTTAAGYANNCLHAAVDSRLVIPIGALSFIIGMLILRILQLSKILVKAATTTATTALPLNTATATAATGVGDKHRRTNRWLVIVAILIALFAIAYFNYLTNLLNFPKLALSFPGKNAIAYSLDGRLVDPLTLAPVGNVDVTTGNTSVHVSNSGQFRFSQINPAAGINITDPLLTRTINYSPDSPTQSELYFNVSLYNRLIEAVNYESMGRVADLYYMLPDSIKSAVSLGNFANNAHTVFNQSNLNDQSLVVKATHIINQWSDNPYNKEFNRVLQVAIEANGQQDNYYFTLDGNWNLIK